MNKEINSNYSIESYINGLSDHDAQILVLRNINIRNQKVQPAVIRQINETTITQFKLHLSEENWSSTFNEEDMEPSFNNFLNEYLRIFNHSFPLKKYYNKPPNQGWLTKELRYLANIKGIFTCYVKPQITAKQKFIIKHIVKPYLKSLRRPKGTISIALLNAPKINPKPCGI